MSIEKIVIKGGGEEVINKESGNLKPAKKPNQEEYLKRQWENQAGIGRDKINLIKYEKQKLATQKQPKE